MQLSQTIYATYLNNGSVLVTFVEGTKHTGYKLELSPDELEVIKSDNSAVYNRIMRALFNQS